MRNELKERLYKFIHIKGVISKFGKMKFDGHENILLENPETGLINPIRFTDNCPIEPIYFATKATLIINASIDGELIGDGHMWIPEDLSSKGFRVGDKVKICGTVEIYQRNNGEYDYCVEAYRIEHFSR